MMGSIEAVSMFTPSEWKKLHASRTYNVDADRALIRWFEDMECIGHGMDIEHADTRYCAIDAYTMAYQLVGGIVLVLHFDYDYSTDKGSQWRICDWQMGRCAR